MWLHRGVPWIKPIGNPIIVRKWPTASVVGMLSLGQLSGDKRPNEGDAQGSRRSGHPRRHAATSSTSVGSSSPVPVLLTRRDTGHMRTRSSHAHVARNPRDRETLV